MTPRKITVTSVPQRMVTAAAASFLVLAACLFTPKPAAAQTGIAGRLLPLRFKLGVLLPQDGDTKNLTNSTHLMGEIDLDLPSVGTTGTTRISLGYAQNFDGDRDLRTIPLTVSRVSSPPNPVAGLTGNLYYGAGAGAYFVRASGGGLPAEDKTLFGGFLVAGYQTPSKLFVEAKYHLVSGDVAGMKPNGFALFLGTRL